MASEVPVTRFRLNDQITSRIRERILSGDLRPGTKLVQADWADQLGTSRMPVRDAFMRLQAEGMLAPAEKGTAVVAALSEKDIRDGYELNAFACGLSVKRAAEIISDRALAELEQIHRGYVEALGRGDLDEVYRLNHAFHRQINLNSGSPRLVSMLRILTAGLPQVGTRLVAAWRERTVTTHAQILEALRARDGDAAAELMRRHIFDAADLAVEHLRAQGFWAGPVEERPAG